MNCYATSTRTRRNVEALRQAGWRLLLTPDACTLHAGFRYAVDNGAWGCKQRGVPFDAPAFVDLVERFGGGADFVVVPDIVASPDSLEFSLSWLPKLRQML